MAKPLNIIDYPAVDRNAHDRVMLYRELFNVIRQDVHSDCDDVAMALEGAVLVTEPNTSTDHALVLLICATLLEPVTDHAQDDKDRTVAAVTLNRIRRSALKLAQGKIPHDILKYYGAV